MGVDNDGMKLMCIHKSQVYIIHGLFFMGYIYLFYSPRVQVSSGL